MQICEASADSQTTLYNKDYLDKFLQHIISNSTLAMGNGMQGWSGWLKSLKAMCNLLRRRYSRQRLQATCFSVEPSSLQWPLFEGFSGHIQDGRWGSIAEASLVFLPLETPLRAAWDIDKFNFHKPVLANDQQGDGNNDGARVDASELDSSITSTFFWAYTFMVTVLCQIINHCMYWVMGCPCHQRQAEFRDIAKSILQMTDATTVLSALHSCPMSGRRVPEVCAGELAGVFSEMWHVCCALLRMDSRVLELSEEEQNTLLTDATIGKQVFMFYISIKTVVFQRLPLASLGLGCTDWEQARQVALHVRTLFRASAPGLTTLLCSACVLSYKLTLAISLLAMTLLPRCSSTWLVPGLKHLMKLPLRASTL